MDSFLFNKVAGAFLGTCLLGMGLGIVAQGIYEPGAPKKPGYALPEPKPEAAVAAKKPAAPPLPVLLAKADVKKGEADAKVCGACHNFQEGAGSKVGPDLYEVVDRDKGAVAGFDYSAGLKGKGGKWTFADLNNWLTKPSAYIPGTKMGYTGEDSPEKRADIIAYLDSLAKKPVPFPQASDADKQAAAGGDKEAKAEPGKPGEEAKGGDKAAGGADDKLLSLIAAADPKKGQADAQVCSACHNFKEGAGALVGPDLYGVVERQKGSVEGYDYSAGLKAKGGKWTYTDLNEWLTKPSAYIKGTKMGYTGESNAKKRAEIIAYLRTLAKVPAPLPGAKPETAETKPLPTGTKAGDQKPPEPPNKPGAPQPVPVNPEAARQAGAPTQPDSAVPPQPARKAEAAPPTPEPKPRAEAPVPASSSSSGARDAGPEPYSAPAPDEAAGKH